MRDAEIRDTMQELLLATGAFDDVWLWGLPENYAGSASEMTAAAIIPVGGTQEDLSDSSADGVIEVTSKAKIVILSRNADPILRDKRAEQLLAITADTLNGVSLATLTFPDRTKITTWSYEEPAPPERRVTAMYTYQYEVESWTGYDESPVPGAP